MSDDEKRQCTATSKQTGKRCGQAPAQGHLVCKWHGGGTGQAKRKAEAREVEREARETFGWLSDHASPVDDPYGALAGIAGEVVAWKDFCAEQIADLTRLRSTDQKGTEQIDARIALFERSMDRCVATLTSIAKLNIEERLARISERQADAVVRAVNAGLESAGMSDEGLARARAVVARELRVAG